jgi:hypothetical protein
MLTILFMLEFAVVAAAMSVVAWLRNPSWNGDDWRLAVLRFLAPPCAVLVVVAAILEFRLWLMGKSLGASPPLWVIIVCTVFLVGSVIMAISAIWLSMKYERRAPFVSHAENTPHAHRVPRVRPVILVT